LVYDNLMRLLKNASAEKRGTTRSGLSRKEALLQTVRSQIKVLKSQRSETEQGKEVAKQFGLGVLKEDYVNICLEAVSSTVLDLCSLLSDELKQEAIQQGAKGYNVVLAGDADPFYPFETVCNTGGVEIPILTGLIDLYAVGDSGLGAGKNIVSAYHTICRHAESAPDREDIKDWFIQSANAYSKRDLNKVSVSDQRSTAELLSIDAQALQARLEQGFFQKICVLAGGSNVQLTEDALLCQAAEQLPEMDVLCLAYGNAAATLGKYGFLTAGIKEASVYWIGNESAFLNILDLGEYIGSEHIVVLMPELSGARDLQAAFAFADAGIKVFTAVRLPVDGSHALAEEIDQLIRYCDPKDFMTQVMLELKA
jgi:hypothetical protein